ncbi:MAG: hypothetical protein ABR591_06735 [Candidatus Velthaea sp.]
MRWDYANQKLDLYFSNNLSQGAPIYLVSLVTILLGSSASNAAWVSVLGGALHPQAVVRRSLEIAQISATSK